MFNAIEIDDSMIIYEGDCLDVMPLLAEQGLKADLILADPPYGTTHCKWDSAIDFVGMWNGIGLLSRDSTPTLLFAQHPFTCTLGCSNLRNLRYSWIWEKTQGTGFLNAKRMPMKCHEDILVFYKKLPKYNPLKTDGYARKVILASHKYKCAPGTIYQKYDNYTDYDSTERYPRSVLKYKTDKQTCALHPTQKPVALLEYFIRTYTDEGDTVIDFVMGSGSTGVACRNTGRKFVGIEKDPACFQTAKKRLSNEN